MNPLIGKRVIVKVPEYYPEGSGYAKHKKHNVEYGRLVLDSVGSTEDGWILWLMDTETGEFSCAAIESCRVLKPAEVTP